MAFLRHMSIGHKILLALLLPLLAMGGFAGLQLHERQQMVSRMDQLQGLTELALMAGDLVHESQRERGSTALFLGTAGRQFESELASQRERTERRAERFDAQLARLRGDIDDVAIQELIEAVRERLSDLPALRRRVDALELPVAEAASRYTELNTALIRIVGRLSHVTSEAQTTRTLGAYFSLLRGKELAGIERAVLATAFGQDRIASADFQRFVSLIGAQQAQLDTFRTLASAQQRELLEEQLGGDEVERVEGLRRRVLESATRRDFGVDPEQWFAWQTAKIDRLMRVEDSVAESVLTLVAGLRSDAQQALVRNGLVAGVVAGLVLLVAILIGRSIAMRLRQAASAMSEIAGGDGDLTRRLAVTHRDEIGALATQFNAFASRMQALLFDVRDSAHQVHAAAEEIARGSQALAARTERDASSLQETSASMEQITATVEHSAESAQQASQLVVSTVSVARQGEAAMGEVGSTMEDINTSAARIGEIITLIDSIAFQTNILALNASVEAARAGEHGRGFAVVAQEVRTLASRSADAARDIRRLIDASVAHTRRGAEIVQRAGVTMDEIVQSVGRVNDVIAEISAGAREQSVGIGQVNLAVSDMDGATQRNVAMVEQTSSAAAEMRHQSERLNALMGAFVLGERQIPEPG
ncbi:methyl-accepting chemotaxis protein [Halomonas sp. NO4]|uniref:methyl-accepting chemotaxis protein n=1 Tax=Halomonas sp. NO4 TaxID=2484813 RepID=UPI0013D2670C|nr:methyl-accepting chemotaxis protein [Halomonas sp. NO4]